ncbi:MAG: hypothetical protein UV22_C0020G0006 [Parcubacteria group bacterium GW2011_GWA2_42_35]|nr:MAG: hypothetical protein UV22_C0020G0006 [Parcubacteria group bacterium GW2011_GWA2_42_35]
MAELTKKDLEDVLDKKLPQYQAAIIEAVDEKFKAVAERFDVIEKKIDDMEIRFNQKLDALMTTLDNFLKRLTDWEQEFNILKYKVDLIKTTLKEKFDIDIRTGA